MPIWITPLGTPMFVFPRNIGKMSLSRKIAGTPRRRIPRAIGSLTSGVKTGQRKKS